MTDPAPLFLKRDRSGTNNEKQRRGGSLIKEPVLTPPHYKTRHACEIQANLCREIRGGICLLSPHLEPNLAISSNHEHCHRRVACLRPRHCMICLRKFGSCSLCSSSACCQIVVVVVREQMHIPNLDFNLTLNLPRTATCSFNLLGSQS